MTQVVYSGAQPARTIVLPSGKNVRAEKGKPVDVPADVAKSLAEQRDWTKVGGSSNGGPTVKDLKAQAAERGIEVPKRAKKAEIEELLASVESPAEDTETPAEPEGEADPAADTAAGDSNEE